MTDTNEPLRRALAEMEATRRRLDREIAAVRRILDGRTPAASNSATRSPKGGTRTAILDVMQDGRPRRAGEIAALIGKAKPSTSAALARMVKLGLVANPAYGVFQIPGGSDETAAQTTLDDGDD